MTIQFPEDALKNVITWQTKFTQHKQQNMTTKMNTPESIKDSREQLHTVENATDHITDWRTFWKDVLEEKKDPLVLAELKDKTIKDFLDTISCALEQLNGNEVFDCFVQAVENEYHYKTKEYDRVDQLFNLVMQPK
jgi:hypothetical protein